MKKVLITATIALSTLVGWVGVASAHILKTDNNIGAVLHIDPADEPIAGLPATFFFEFKDKQSKFQPAACNCQFSISENGQSIYSQPLFQSSSTPTLTNALVTYTFPKADSYKITVVGQPTQPAAFQSFSLVYDVRVSSDTHQHTSHTIHYVFGGLAAAFVVLYIATLKRRHRD